MDQAASPAPVLDVYVDLTDGMNSLFNGAQPQAVTDPQIAGILGMAQIAEVQNQQISITADFQNVYIKDVASYTCAAAAK